MMAKRHMIAEEPNLKGPGKSVCGVTIDRRERNWGRFQTDINKVTCSRCLTFYGGGVLMRVIGTDDCQHCGEPYDKVAAHQLYCSSLCRHRAKESRRKGREPLCGPRRSGIHTYPIEGAVKREQDYGASPPPDKDYFKRWE